MLSIKRWLPAIGIAAVSKVAAAYNEYSTAYVGYDKGTDVWPIILWIPVVLVMIVGPLYIGALISRFLEKKTGKSWLLTSFVLGYAIFGSAFVWLMD